MSRLARLGAAVRDRLVPSRPGLVLASGVLLGLAHPPFRLLLPSFVGLVPFVWWLEGLPAGEEGRSEAKRGGFLLGFVYFSIMLYWLVTALIWYTPLAVLAFLAPALILAWFTSLMTLGIHGVRDRLGWPAWIALPVFWTAVEWFRSHIPQIGFPWMQLGDSLAYYPRLAGAADLVGVRGLSFWLVTANALLAAALLRRRRRAGGLAPVLALLVILLLPIGYSLLRWETLELRPAARVAVVQPNVPEDIKLQHEIATDSAMRATETLVARHAAAWRGEVDLLVLPETVLPQHLEYRPDLLGWTAALGERLETRVLIGGFGADALGEGEYAIFNSAFLLEPDGAVGPRYDKRYLVPVVERVPFVNPAWFTSQRYFGGFGRGVDAPTYRTDGAGFGILICYESIYTRLTRHYRRNGADFLVNITNDAWFGREEPWWSRSSALWQHPAHLVMRSIESRMGSARSANTGISMLVDPLGRVSHETELFVAAAFAGTVMTSDARTLYVRVGDLVGPASMLGALAGILLAALPGRAERRGG